MSDLQAVNTSGSVVICEKLGRETCTVAENFSAYLPGHFSGCMKYIMGVCLMLVPLATASETLGKIDFPTSGSPAAQVHFERGVLLLHSFEYDDAAEEFRKAQLVEPHFAMAYWGEAMTHNKPLWGKLDRQAGQRVLLQLGETQEMRSAKAPTMREKIYLGAIETLFFFVHLLSREKTV